ncbi:aldehyde dehydrogenase family protein [Aestuariibius sp. 2305UL40-4]|uniref:aldehyde dehydrogenase family protein n=1 Tax=Aestuariibius violaceus TaxID=3234132 RepID=UPI00345EE077
MIFRIVSPIDGSIYAEREAMPLEAARAAAARARAAQPAWAALPLAERIAVITGAVELLRAMNDTLVTELAWQMGRPVRYGGEIGGIAERAGWMAENAADALAPLEIEDSPAFMRRIERAPVGVVLVIAPWNYPYLTAINGVFPALIAGNTVVLKHAEQTMLTGERLAEALHAAGAPDDVFQNIMIEHPVAETLMAERAFDSIGFTGSVVGGRAVERAAAGSFAAVGLELGGKDPAYVMEDADLDAAVEGVMDGATFNAGQCCCGIERIYVHRNHYEAFVEAAVAWTEKLRLGNPLDPETTLGPMAARRFADVVRRHVTKATAAGARALVDPAKFPADDGGTYVAPQVLIDVTHDMDVMREETFGPVVGIMPVDNDEEAVRLMNDSPFGLTASLWTGDAERALALGRRIETGTVFLNRADYLDPALCWTGCKLSGRGATLSRFGFESVTRPRSYHLRKASP